jgi:inosine-uridine nucleoside N-ribohydrolase
MSLVATARRRQVAALGVLLMPTFRCPFRDARWRLAGALTLLVALAGGAATTTSPAPGASPSGAPGPAVGTPAPSVPVAAGTPVLIDTDLGWDDLAAIAYVASRPDVRLVGVAVSGTGEVRCPAGVGVAAGLLARLGHPTVPVACGTNEAGPDGTPFPAAWRDGADHGSNLELPAVPPAANAPDAIDLIRAAAAADPGALRVIELGPATNLADAFAADPSLRASIHDITAMGGAVTAPGNVRGSGAADDNATAEWNVFADPSAWQAMLESGVPTTMVPLDATDDVPVSQGMYLTLAANRGSTAATQLVFDLLASNPSVFGPGESFWDSLTSVAAFHPEVVERQSMPLRVRLESGPSLGGIALDASGPTIAVATAADEAAFRAEFLSTLAGGAPVASPLEPETTFETTFDGTTCAAEPAFALRADSAVALRFENRAATPAVVAIARLADGVSPEDLEHTVATDPDQAGSMAEPVVVAGAEAGQQGSGIGIVARPGTYVLACLMYEGDGARYVPVGSVVVAP